MRALRRFFRRGPGTLWRDGRASIAVEIAFVMPLIVVIALGAVELGRYVMLNIKLEHASDALSDLTTRDEKLSQADVRAIFRSVQEIASPFDLTKNGAMFISAVSADGTNPARVFWQVKARGGIKAKSHVGMPGGRAAMPAKIKVHDRETVVVSEVFYKYQPILKGFVPAMVIHKQALYRPRAGSLRSLSK
jgi:Flp pilus assembly protein TadG